MRPDRAGKVDYFTMFLKAKVRALKGSCWCLAGPGGPVADAAWLHAHASPPPLAPRRSHTLPLQTTSLPPPPTPDLQPFGTIDEPVSAAGAACLLHRGTMPALCHRARPQALPSTA